MTLPGDLLQYLRNTLQQGVAIMPNYEYVCQECKKTFSVIMTITEYEKAKPACPKCKSKKVQQKPAAFFAVTSKKS